MTQVAPYGTWASPITAADVASEDARPGWPGWVHGDLWWTESRPNEEGRVTLMRRRASPAATPAGTDAAEEMLPAPWYVRSRVIEYGGQPWAARPAGAAAPVVFANWADQRLYRLEPEAPGREPRPVSPVPEISAGMRFADMFIHPELDEVWCVRETRTGPAPTDVARDIVAVPLDGSAAEDPRLIRVLAASHHFLCCPRLSPDGERLSWIGWDHPSMPWDETVLCVAEVTAGQAGPATVVAGGGRQAIVQAEWAGPRTLIYVNDPDGWWNLYRLELPSGEPDAPHGPALHGQAPHGQALCPREEEFGGAMWQLGQRWLAPLADGTIAAVHGRGASRLSILGPDGVLRAVDSPYTEWASCLTASGTEVAAVAASPRRAHEVVRVDAVSGEIRVVRPAPAGPADPAYLPEPQARSFRTADGHDIHASVYPPRNPAFTGPPAQPPPYVVFVHGGPTGRASMVYDLEISYFTSRGIGVAEVNYGGSTGYGRAYRERLVHNWGLVDTADCAEVARALAAEGTADGSRLAIRGGSAGGWTAACSLVTDGTYQGGVIYYPILDLAGWRTGETHDFESQYLESLVGPWPQASAVYHDRSPVNRADRLSAPFLLLQGLEDMICPPLQAERFLDRVAGRGIPHAYLAFEGEQHGFRRAGTVVAALEAELSFLGQVLGFEPPDVPRLRLAT
jgi:dipeptidyl aminopeptidase/acylaminoacyl peptidase